MPKPGNRAANQLMIRFAIARLKAAIHLLRNRITKIPASSSARIELIDMAITMFKPVVMFSNPTSAPAFDSWKTRAVDNGP
jgi:hypothetical protein